ncbi:MAG TPA: chemotaxis-specific protein-glutamate methyltransferase CheB [Hyphomonadaceae bacterium]|nr:chemotaxis-specific protein-glutamate methyltransferase CheB [Hyphomonadaceae bacterium]
MSLAAPKPAAGRRVRVLLADDSAIVRGFVRRWIDEDARIELVKACSDGAQAVTEAAACKPDVIVLDIEMPNLDGLSALPQLRKAAPDARIVMASTLTTSGAAATVKALALGASDFIAKPDANAMGSVANYRRDLIEKIVALGERNSAPSRAADIRLRARPAITTQPAAMLVAASTGGPNALPAFLAPVARRIEAPILIVQHMPAAFTPIFAEKLTNAAGKLCREAKDGDLLAPGSIYLAPGDHHMRIARCPAGRMIHLDKGEPVNFCRPAADPLFESAVAAFGSRLLAVVLTGMGHDGRDGAGKVVEAGGRVIVQDEASSVVWGMPGAVALAGHAEAVRPLKDLPQLALRLMNGDPA